MSLGEAYRTSFLEFLKGSDESKNVVNYLKNRQKLRDAGRVLSVGAGVGSVDGEFLKFLPNLKSYTAVEPDDMFRELLREKLKQIKKEVKVELVAGRLQTYPGPPEPVDLILMVHVCYHLENLKEQIKRALEWLTPEGHLVLIHQQPDDCKTEIEMVMHGHPLKCWHFAKLLKEMKIPFTEETFQFAFEMTSSNMTDFVHIMASKGPSAEQMEKCEKILERYTEGGSTIRGTQVAHIIHQSALNTLK